MPVTFQVYWPLVLMPAASTIFLLSLSLTYNSLFWMDFTGSLCCIRLLSSTTGDHAAICLCNSKSTDLQCWCLQHPLFFWSMFTKSTLAYGMDFTGSNCCIRLLSSSTGEHAVLCLWHFQSADLQCGCLQHPLFFWSMFTQSILDLHITANNTACTPTFSSPGCSL